MGKAVRIALWSIGGVLALVAVAAAAIVVTFDPDDYRDEISQMVERQTGRTMSIDGPIELHWFPWLGVTIADVRLGNAPGFGPEPMASLRRLGVSVAVLPLLRGRAEIDTIRIKGLKLMLARDRNGRDNWSDLAAGRPADSGQPAEPDPDRTLAIPDGRIAGIVIEDAALYFDDRTAGNRYAIEVLKLTTGAVAPGQPVDLTLGTTLHASQPQLAVHLQLQTTATPDGPEYRRITLAPLALEVRFEGPGVPAGSQQARLTARASLDRDALRAELADVQLRFAELGGRMSAQAELVQPLRWRADLALDEFSPRALMQRLGIKPPLTADESVLNRARLQASLAGDGKSAKAESLVLRLDDTRAEGTLSIADFASPTVRFDLNADAIDVDRYLPPDSGAGHSQGNGGGTPLNEIRIPAETLDAIDATGRARVGMLKLKGLRLSQVELVVNARRGQPKSQQLSAKAYGGEIIETSRLIPGKPPRYATTVQLSSVDAGALLRDLLGKDWISGNAVLKLDANGEGHTVGDLRKSLDGTVELVLHDGAIRGYNLAQQIRKARAALRGEQLSDQAPQQTDFAELRFVGRITDGVLSTDALSAKNPLLRLTGSGSIDLLAETIDLVARPVIVESSKGQGGADLAELRGIPIPLRITGPLSAPKVRLDLEAALKEKLKAEAASRLGIEQQQLRERQQQLEAEAREKLKKEEDRLKQRLKDKLGDFLRQKSAPPDEDKDGSGDGG